jgi:hypothetical protein
MANNNTEQKKALEMKLDGLKAKLETLKLRGAGWGKAIRRTESFIEQVKAELAVPAASSKPVKAESEKTEPTK